MSSKEKVNGNSVNKRNFKSSSDSDDDVPWAKRIQNSSAINKNKKVFKFFFLFNFLSNNSFFLQIKTELPNDGTPIKHKSESSDIKANKKILKTEEYSDNEDEYVPKVFFYCFKNLICHFFFLEKKK